VDDDRRVRGADNPMLGPAWTHGHARQRLSLFAVTEREPAPTCGSRDAKDSTYLGPPGAVPASSEADVVNEHEPPFSVIVPPDAVRYVPMARSIVVPE